MQQHWQRHFEDDINIQEQVNTRQNNTLQNEDRSWGTAMPNVMLRQLNKPVAERNRKFVEKCFSKIWHLNSSAPRFEAIKKKSSNNFLPRLPIAYIATYLKQNINSLTLEWSKISNHAEKNKFECFKLS